MTDFSELGLSPQILQAVADSGYTEATPIQAAAIPVALAGGDILGIAQTGTGKTAAFTLPMIDRLAQGRSKARMPRSLVIAPTRELADQVAESFAKYSKYQKLSWALLIGGVSFEDQIKKLDRGVDVLIATPGRLLDHFERGKLLLTGVQMMVVDEADRMLDMGFIPDLERIFKLTPVNKQTLFFSATMPPEITRLTKQFLTDPTRIEASKPATTAENITQHLVRIPSADPAAKRTALRALVGAENVKNGIVFCNRKTEVDIVAKSLRTHGFDASAIHGDLDQATRMRTLDAFRKGDLKILVASDVAARGLDIPDVSHVFNYDVPHHADDYVHRIGRTGRAGRSGDTYMLVTPADGRQLDKVLKLIGQNPHEVTLDVDWSQVKESPRREKGGRDRSPRSRGPVRDHAPKERRPLHEQAAMTPAVPQPAAEAWAEPAAQASATAETPATERAPRQPREGERPRSRPRKARAEVASAQSQAAPSQAAPPQAAPAEPKPERSREERRPRREDREDRDDNHGVRGFGADTPAFLLRGK